MNSEQKNIIKSIEEDESKIFLLVKQGQFDIIENLITTGKINLLISDDLGNTIIYSLLRAKQYNLVELCLSKRKIDINHQNKDGNTISHMLVKDCTVHSANILNKITKKKNYIPNIKNNLGESVLDMSISSDYNYLGLKLVEDKRLVEIDFSCFEKLISTYVKNDKYGKITKVDNLEKIIYSMDKKIGLIPVIEELVKTMIDNLDIIKYEIMSNKFSYITNLLYEAAN